MKRALIAFALLITTFFLAACDPMTISVTGIVKQKTAYYSNGANNITAYRLSLKEVSTEGGYMGTQHLHNEYYVDLPTTDPLVGNVQVGDSIKLSCLDYGDISEFDYSSCRLVP